jgi:hypothetical protein
VKIEFLFWEECPSHPEALALLRDVLEQRGVTDAIDVREVLTHEEAVELGFPGSPTIRVDGRDVDQDGANWPPGLSCRVYRLPDGRPSPVPSRQQLEEAFA